MPGRPQAEYDEENWPTSPRVMARDVLPDTLRQIGMDVNPEEPGQRDSLMELARFAMSIGDHHALATVLGELMMQAKTSGAGQTPGLGDLVSRMRTGRAMAGGQWQ